LMSDKIFIAKKGLVFGAFPPHAKAFFDILGEDFDF
jgi:hypothetical protein